MMSRPEARSHLKFSRHRDQDPFGGPEPAACACRGRRVAFADDLDKTADMLRQLSSGNLNMQRPDTAAMQQHGNDLAEACGFNGFRLG